MKRFVMIATLIAFVLGLAVTASAADLVATGSWKIAAAWVDNMDALDDQNADTEDDFIMEQRVRTSFTFTANENLRGVLQIEIGTSQWGAPGGGADLGADDIAIEVKSAYVNFVWPNTDVGIFAGVMPIALPGGPGGNPIFDEDVAAVVLTAPILDSVSLLGGWARPYDLANGAGGIGATTNDDQVSEQDFLDVLFLAVPMDFDGVALTPYVAYVYSGDDFLLDLGSGGVAGVTAATAYANWNTAHAGLMSQNMTVTDLDNDTDIDILYLGTTFDITLLDPFNISGAFHWGSTEMPDSNQERAGWLGEIAVEYTGFDFVTPQLYFAYSSGEDGNGTDGDDTGSSGGSSERLPTIAESYEPGSFWFGGEFLDGLNMPGGESQLGFWTVGLFLKDISFVEGLTHEINIMYIEGTNDESIGNGYNAGALAGGTGTQQGTTYGATLTEKDSVWEFDLNTKYQIYDELSAIVRLGYLDIDMDDTVWGNTLDGNPDAEDAAKLVIGVEYSF